MISDKTAKLFIALGTVVFIAVLIIWQWSIIMSLSNHSVIPAGVKINGYDVSGYDRASAEQLLSIHLGKEINSQKLVLEYEDINVEIDPKSFTELSYQEALEKAYSYGNSGDIITDYLSLFKAKLFGVSFDAEIVFDDIALEDTLISASALFLVPALDAQIVSFDPSAAAGARLSIVSQENGRQLDIEKTSDSVKQSIIKEKDQADAYIKVTQADITDDMLHGLEDEPIISEFTINSVSLEYETAISQVVGAGKYKILMPGDEISTIELMGGEDYIYFEMPDGGTGSDYENILTIEYPTQIFIASVMAELTVTERKLHNITADNVPAGASTVTNQYYDMKIKNDLSAPVIIRVGYKKEGSSGFIFCEVYRPKMEYKTLLRSVIKEDNGKTTVDITRVYVDNIGNKADTVIVETVEAS